MNADEAENIGYVIPSLVVTHFLSPGSGGESALCVVLHGFEPHVAEERPADAWEVHGLPHLGG
jgi:hypothetical protein